MLPPGAGGDCALRPTQVELARSSAARCLPYPGVQMVLLRASLIVATCLLVYTACGTRPPDTEPDEYEGPAVVDLSPSPDQQDFYFKDNLWARFDSAPSAALFTLLDADSNPVSGQISSSDEGTLYTFDPGIDLVPAAAYTLEIQTGTDDSPPLQVAFQTSAHGLPTNAAAGGLASTVFHLDVSDTVVLEPAIAEGLIVSEVGGWNLLLGFADVSNFDAAAQPGVHLHASLARAKGSGWEPDPCSRTASLTFGSDGLQGTTDDAAATWADPYLELGPRDIDFLVGLVQASVQDLHFKGLFHPDLTDMMDFDVEGIFDTRALDFIFRTGSEEGITCGLLEPLGISCHECGGSNAGPFCIQIIAKKIAAERVDVPALTARTCADVVTYGLATGECAEQIDVWEPAADGTYALCPEYVPPDR